MEIYQVKSGDSLVGISREVLGDKMRWRDIATLNNIKSPYIIQPGQQLVMPDVEVLDPVVVPRVPRRGTRPTPDEPIRVGFDIEPQTMAYLAVGALLLFLAMDKK